MKFFSTLKGKVLGAIAIASAMSTNASAAIDLSAVTTNMTSAQGEIEGFAPVVLGFILVSVVVGAFIKLVRRAS